MARHRDGRLLAGIVSALMAVGCTDPAEPGQPPTATPSPTVQPSPSADPTPGRPVTFAASDGVRIAGRVFGAGRVGVVLGHQIDGDQRDWWDFALRLADEGYAALSINFRGYCPQDGAGCSGDGGTANAWRDLLAGVGVLRRRGVENVVFIGASMGGTASLVAAAQARPAVAGVTTLSAPTDCCGMDADATVVESIDAPLLSIAGRFDGDAPQSARRFARWAGSSGESVILASGEHGTDLIGGLATPQVERRTTDLILEFLDRITRQ
jgi:pimeloyl-ACP methyl ester carboxylesterase